MRPTGPGELSLRGPGPCQPGPCQPGPRTPDAGSATVWWISLCVLLWFLTYALLLTAAARLDRDRASAAADLAALAAAARAHEGTGTVCAAARRTAEANGATLDTCELSGLTVTVTVSLPASALPREVSARARAGPVHNPSEEVE
ncbi:flp pilus-assembly TadE/G-like family protein [Nocardiopsis exhalans]|uniref:Flp pilus-assembly TadE/G-like family protein n=1 Tax=Nocardiopsis exhalans TaxID=163604 RepID=A0ABY5D9R4_9ACTN|nr:Rv3654c family TadE-like protein [Nocardiopsis exhalans]USY20125.1 flp pilus-assembly TadE/G-like family protein [Nocardiopsis exhalans]